MVAIIPDPGLSCEIREAGIYPMREWGIIPWDYLKLGTVRKGTLIRARPARPGGRTGGSGNENGNQVHLRSAVEMRIILDTAGCGAQATCCAPATSARRAEPGGSDTMIRRTRDGPAVVRMQQACGAGATAGS